MIVGLFWAGKAVYWSNLLNLTTSHNAIQFHPPGSFLLFIMEQRKSCTWLQWVTFKGQAFLNHLIIRLFPNFQKYMKKKPPWGVHFPLKSHQEKMVYHSNIRMFNHLLSAL